MSHLDELAGRLALDELTSRVEALENGLENLRNRLESRRSADMNAELRRTADLGTGS